MEPIVSLEKITAAANAAARQGVPLASANTYPQYSGAWGAFNDAYAAACGELYLEAA